MRSFSNNKRFNLHLYMVKGILTFGTTLLYRAFPACGGGIRRTTVDAEVRTGPSLAAQTF